MKTPVVFIIFKRPQTTQRVFNLIRQAKPSRLFVLADGPRATHPGEAEKCAETRAIIDQVDWDCDVIRRYSDTNLGLGPQFSQGLTWVFEQVEEAIILEDDCIVHPSFFPFCEELLERYRHEPHVFSISAQNVQLGRDRTPYSYYFSRYSHIWGWATWRRAWKYYDYQMSQWPRVSRSSFLKELLGDRSAVEYWREVLQATYDGRIKTWDYQWTLSCWINQGLSIIPNVNLVNNIGFGEDSTNFQSGRAHIVNRPEAAIGFPLKHPPRIEPCPEADKFTQRRSYEGGRTTQMKRQIKRWLKRVLQFFEQGPENSTTRTDEELRRGLWMSRTIISKLRKLV